MSPETTPLVVPIVIDPVPDVLLHVPPGVASLRTIVDPTQTFPGPLIAAGSGMTATDFVVTQPDPNE